MLSIVIPCYNEAVVIEESVDKVIDFMKYIGVDYELLLINDGSTDNSKEIFAKIDLKYEVVKSYSYDRNRGKGYAVNYGFKKIYWRYGFIYGCRFGNRFKCYK